MPLKRQRPNYARARIARLVAAFVLTFNSITGHAAPQGVAELTPMPEKLADAEPAKLLGAEVAKADVIAIGESVHGCAGFLQIPARLIRNLVERHGLRLIVRDNPALRSVEFVRRVTSCTRAKSAPPVDVSYVPTAADNPLWTWVCDCNHAHPSDPIVFRGMGTLDRPWEHDQRIGELGAEDRVSTALLMTVENECPGRRASSWAEIGELFAVAARDRGFHSPAAFARCRDALMGVHEACRQLSIDTKHA